MSETTRIIRRRYLREQKTARGRLFAARAVLIAVFACIVVFAGLTLLFLGTVAGVYDYFTSSLPDFSEMERLGQDTEATFETTKIFAWGDDPDGDGDLSDGIESGWSDYFSVDISNSKPVRNLFLQILEALIERFPILEKLFIL